MEKIAVTYENGNIFQHFGHTENFKIYSIENGAIVSSEVVDTNGSGHGALAGFLKERQVSYMICGGIGGGAVIALKKEGITVIAGVTGKCDDAVGKYLDGTLDFSSVANCSHHDSGHEEGHSCGNGGCKDH